MKSIVVLAAGRGTRMKSEIPKVLHLVCGAPMLSHVLSAAGEVGAEKTVVVLGHGHEQVEPYLAAGCEVVRQEEQLGTGHALLMASEEVEEGPMLVLSGDTPLLTGETLREFVGAHFSSGAQASMVTMELEDPTSYGRVMRAPGGEVERIVEHGDAGPGELAVKEVNAGAYILPATAVMEVLRSAGQENSQEEIYLTDAVTGLVERGAVVRAFPAADPGEFMGVNTRVELAEAQTSMRRRLCRGWMLAGVTMEDPASVYLDAGVQLAPDVRLLPNTILRGSTEVGRGSEVGPDCTLIDTVVGEECTVRHSYSEKAVLGNRVTVGPFAYLRPEARLEDESKAGTFVEIKKSRLGPKSKVPHLSYIGDTEIGTGTNIGAGNITANYDGREKHRTTIGDQVNTGSDTVLVAPVTIGDNVTIGAGSVITKDVPAGALGIARARQKNIQNYVPWSDARKETEEHGR